MRVGIDVGGTKLLVLAENGRTWQFPTGASMTPGGLVDLIRGVLPEEPESIGLALPGLVTPEGVVQDSDVLPHLRGWRPADDFPALGAVLNDGEAALTEFAASAKPEATLAVVGCGTGIVVALQVAGVRLREHRPFSGELGYAPYGHEGTFDEHASGHAVQTGQRDVQEAAEAFGASLATVLHVIHPERIGLYGGALRHPGYLDTALAAMRRRSLPALLADCEVGLMPEPELAVARGALRAARRA